MNNPTQLESIFHSALNKALPEERAAFLAEACVGDAALREQLERMLAAQDGSFLNSPPDGVAETESHLGATSLSPAPPLPCELSSLFPQLEILELIGQGGMGAVYKARQLGLERLVALKVLPSETGRELAFAERFTREAQALARLSHPHIVSVHDFGQVEGQFYLVMEFVDGVNLRQAIRAGSLAPKNALEIVTQVCEALQFAHEEGVVHRDIKPENILLDRRGRVKIADFGLAKMLGADIAAPALTGTHQVMGTLRYMSPEQMAGSRDVDHRADIYSLGVVFYELLTGEVPMGKFQPPSAKVQVDVRFDEVVLKSLEREPERRYQHASEVKCAVESISSQSDCAPLLSPSPTSDAESSGDLMRDFVRRIVRFSPISLFKAKKGNPADLSLNKPFPTHRPHAASSRWTWGNWEAWTRTAKQASLLLLAIAMAALFFQGRITGDESESVESSKISRTVNLGWPRPWCSIVVTGHREYSIQDGAQNVHIEASGQSAWTPWLLALCAWVAFYGIVRIESRKPNSKMSIWTSRLALPVFILLWLFCAGALAHSSRAGAFQQASDYLSQMKIVKIGVEPQKEIVPAPNAVDSPQE